MALMAGDEVMGSSMTTPEPVQLQSTLALFLEKQCSCTVMEVSSHALSQHRVDGIPYEVAVFTNLTQDHLDYHGTMEAYAAEKKKLFSMTKLGVFNADDPTPDMQDGVPCDVLTFGIDNKADIMAKDVHLGAEGIRYTLHPHRRRKDRTVHSWPVYRVQFSGVRGRVLRLRPFAGTDCGRAA
ncbi:MAG: Mur ligase family protein [Christensenellales bacterium]